jgi:hypothetical protein
MRERAWAERSLARERMLQAAAPPRRSLRDLLRAAFRRR